MFLLKLNVMSSAYTKETINWCPCCENEELIDEEDSYCQTCLIRISNGKEGDSSFVVIDKVNNICWKPRKKNLKIVSKLFLF